MKSDEAELNKEWMTSNDILSGTRGLARNMRGRGGEKMGWDLGKVEAKEG